MRKQKTKNLLKLMGSMLLVIVLVLSLVACNAPTDGGNDDGDEIEEVITPVRNGSFEYFTGDSALLTPNNWSYKTDYGIESGDDNVYNYRGVINVSAAGFDAEGTHLSKNPGKVGDDDYVLMINNVLPFSATYSSTAVTIEQDKYYALTINVKTANIAEDSNGAYIYVINGSSSTRNYVAKFENVKANDWTTYTSYIKANSVSNSSVYVKLAMGEGDDDSDNLAQGVAFFDELDLKEITKAEYDEATTNANIKANDKIARYDLAVPNAEFDNTSSTTTSTTSTKTPYNWYTKRGADDNGENEAPTTGRSRGIIDITQYKGTQSTGALANKYVKDVVQGDLLPANSIGNNVLMLYFYNTESPSAHAYYSDSFTFKSEKEYKLTFWMLTYGIRDVNGQENSEKGVTVKLGDTTLFKNENTNGAWREYTVYIDGSLTQDKAQALYFWLGTGHENDKSNYVSGAAFFDCISLVEIDQTDFDASVESDVLSKVDYSTVNLLDDAIGNAFADDTLWSGKLSADVATPAQGKESVLSLVDLDNLTNADWGVDADLSVEDGKSEREGHNKALAIYNKTATAYNVNFNHVFTIEPNTSYRLSMWVKTYNITTGKGISIKLTNLGDNKVLDDVDAEDGDDSVISTVSTVNTETLATKDVEYKNDWTEVVFYVTGHQSKSNVVALSVEFGSGTRYSPDNLLSGTAFMRNMYLENLTYSEFNNVSASTNVNKYSFIQDSYSSVTNGNFNLIDADKTHDLVSGELDKNPGAPASWTGAYDKSTTSSEKEVSVVSGIVNEKVFNNILLANAGSVGGVNVFPYSDEVLENTDILFNGEPNLLMIWNKGATAYGYTATQKSLTANSYYKVQVNVKTHVPVSAEGANISIAHGNTVHAFKNVNTEGNWKTYTFFIEVGLNSSTAKINLALGGDTRATGVAFFDNVWYSTINEEDYNEAVASDSVMKYSLTTDSFDNVSSEDEIAQPSNFTGAIVSGAPSSSKYYTAGIIDSNQFSENVQEDFGLTKAPEAHTGNELLAINLKDVDNGSAYAYTSTKYTFSANGYYKVSVWAKVQSIGEDDKAIVKLTLSETDTATFDVTETEWTEFSFLVKMDDSDLSEVTLKLALGEYNKDEDDKVITADYAKGYAFFDDVTIEKITEDEYTAGTAGDYLKKIDVVANNEALDNEEEEKEETPATGLDAGAIIGIVSASLLSVAVVAVLVIVFVKNVGPKIKEKRSKKFKKPGYNKRSGKPTGKDDLDKFKD